MSSLAWIANPSASASPFNTEARFPPLSTPRCATDKPTLRPSYAASVVLNHLSGSVHKRGISSMVSRFNFRPGADQEARNLGPTEIAGESECAVASVIARLVSKTFGEVKNKQHLQDMYCTMKVAFIYKISPLHMPGKCRGAWGHSFWWCKN